MSEGKGRETNRGGSRESKLLCSKPLRLSFTESPSAGTIDSEQWQTERIMSGMTSRYSWFPFRGARSVEADEW